MALINTEKKQDSERPLKRAKTGFEVEMHILKADGSLSNKGFMLSNVVKKEHPEVDVVKECGKNMLELGCYPDINTYNPALNIIESIEKVIEVGKKHDLLIYPFSTYPGKTNTYLTHDRSGKYEIQQKIFGKEKFLLATKVVGFHHHYALPKGVFDYEKKDLRLLIDSKLKRSLLNSYNFEIAIDPILTLLTQSSPFFEGKILGKNSRMLVYRGGKKLKYPGLYNKHQMLGGLPPYKQTETDLIRSLKRRRQKWLGLIKKYSPESNPKKLYPLGLDISWNPVKINKHGTLEFRGMDMNFMSIQLAVSAMIKFTLRKIQRDFVEVIPSDIGIYDSFKIRRGIMFIPPHTYVRENLQKAAAYEGFDNEELYDYTKKFFRLAKKLSPKFYRPLYNRIEMMIQKRQSVSDEMIAYIKKNNLIDSKGNISNRNARTFALHYNKLFEKDLQNTKEMVLQIIEDHKKIINS